MVVAGVLSKHHPVSPGDPIGEAVPAQEPWQEAGAQPGVGRGLQPSIHRSPRLGPVLAWWVFMSGVMGRGVRRSAGQAGQLPAAPPSVK